MNIDTGAITALSPDFLLAGAIVLFGAIAALAKNWGKIKAAYDNIYHYRKKQEEYKTMLTDADTKTKEHEDTLRDLNGAVDGLEHSIEDYEQENEKHWRTSKKYREQYEQKFRELEDRCSALAKNDLEITSLITNLSSSSKTRERQIDALIAANKALLADKINQRYNRYIALQGIPADEVDEFTILHASYNGVGGNNVGDAKYNYVMQNLPIIPVETKLVIHHE